MKFALWKKSSGRDAVVDRLVRRIAADNSIDIGSDRRCLELLTEAVGAACDYARGMVDELGQPFVVDRNRPTASTLGSVLFDSQVDAVEALRNSDRVRAVFTDTEARECFFLLTMHRHEYVVFGTEMEGEMVRRDVMQNAVEFLDHRFSAAAPALGELRDMLTENVVLFLADLAPHRQRRDEKTRTEIHASEALLQAQMKTLDLALRENRSVIPPAGLQSKISQGSREMAGLKEKLTALSEKPDPRQCVMDIRETLLAPRNNVHLESVEMRIGDFGVKSDAGRLIRFHECVFGNGERLAVFLASIDRDNARHVWPDLPASS
jgi:hypothetical protein